MYVLILMMVWMEEEQSQSSLLICGLSTLSRSDDTCM